MKQHQKTLLVWLLFLFVVVAFWVAYGSNSSQIAEKKFSEVIASIEEGQVKDVKVQETAKGYVFTGEYKDEFKNANGNKFSTLGVLNNGTVDALQKSAKDHGTTFEVEAREGGGAWLVLLQWLPMVIILVFFVFFVRQLQSGGGKAMSFGKSRARLMNENQNKVTFADVAGVEESKGELEEIVQFLKDPKKFTRLGGRIPKGVLLVGPPGTGKTLLARAIAGEAGVPFFSIAGSDFVEMFVGVGASRVRDLFEQGKKSAPCIIFIDEIDAVGRQRGAGMGGGHDEREQTLNQMLVEMDGFESSDGVIIIAATNRPDVLDPAILRPGRFDRRVVVPRPDVQGREQIFRVHMRKVPVDKDVDVEMLARMTPGMSGADIENLVNEAALIAARADKNKVAMSDFESARDKVLMGTERRSAIMSKRELETTAYHEAGHALVGTALGGADADPVHKVTIIPRGSALGITMNLPNDRLTITKRYVENMIAMLMGGRLAEEIIFGEYNSGASNDIDRATDLARRMVCEWGMSEKMGPLAFGRKEGEIFLGREMMQSQNYSESTAQEIDAEVRRVVTEQYERARRILQDNVDKLHAMAKALLEYETIDKNDIDVLISGGTIARAKPSVRIKTREQVEEERARKSEQTPKAPVLLGDPLPEPGSA